MNRIKKEDVASGVIGNYAIPWVIEKQRDIKHGYDTYALLVNEDIYGFYDSVLDALSVLVDTFKED